MLPHVGKLELDYIDFPLQEICQEAAALAQEDALDDTSIKKYTTICFKKPKNPIRKNK